MLGDSSIDKMRRRLTYLFVGLYVVVVLVSLFRENWWVLFGLCTPVLVNAVNKVIKRYL